MHVVATMLLKWKVIALRSGYKVKIKIEHPYSGYTVYGVHEIIEWAARHRLHHGLDTALILSILLNKCVVVGHEVIPKLHLIMSKTLNQREGYCNGLISVSMQRFGERKLLQGEYFN